MTALPDISFSSGPISHDKGMFFDRPKVAAMMDKATLENLRKAGALVRKIAQHSMPYASAASLVTGRARPSAPGQPPRAIRSHPWLRKFLYFSLDPANLSVVIGPELLSRSTYAQRTLEFGGRVTIVNRRRRTRLVGGAGEIEVNGRPGATTHRVVNAAGQVVNVTYMRLRTPLQAVRANRINEELYGPPSKTVYVSPRPFMGPALEATKGALPSLWRDSL